MLYTDRSDHKPKQFFLIIGCGRSGTTLLQSICSRHSSVYVGPETKFLAHFPLNMDLSHPSAYCQAYLKIVELSAKEEIPLHNFDYFWQHAPRTHAGLFTAWLQAGSQHHQAHIIGDASNIHTAHALWLAKQIPQLKIIHLWRDPRDVAASQKRLWQTSMTRFVMRYWRSFHVYQHAQKKLADRYYALRYEDLVQNPESSIKQLCHAMDWDYQPVMLQPHKRTERGFASREIHKLGTLEAMSCKHIGKYKKELSEEEIAFIEKVCMFPMRHFNYVLATEQSSSFSPLSYTQVVYRLMKEVPAFLKEQWYNKIFD